MASSENDPFYLSIVTTTDPFSRQLPNLLQALSDLAVQESTLFEVIIVDDLKLWSSHSNGCFDVKNFSNLTIRILWYPEQRGQVNAILSGIKLARSSALLTIDPDMHHCVPELPLMYQLLKNGYLVVHGNRLNRPETGALRLFASYIVNAIVRLVSGIAVKDIGCSVALHRTSCLIHEDILTASNPRLTLYHKLGKKVTNYPINNQAARNSSSHYTFRNLLPVFTNLINSSILLRINLIKRIARRNFPPRRKK